MTMGFIRVISIKDLTLDMRMCRITKMVCGDREEKKIKELKDIPMIRGLRGREEEKSKKISKIKQTSPPR